MVAASPGSTHQGVQHSLGVEALQRLGCLRLLEIVRQAWDPLGCCSAQSDGAGNRVGGGEGGRSGGEGGRGQAVCRSSTRGSMQCVG